MTEIIECVLESLRSGKPLKLSRDAKKALARKESGWKRPKRPRKISVAQKLHRKEKKKAKAKIERENRKIKMIEHLVKNGWLRGGVMNDVWTFGTWKTGYDDLYKTTLHKAYKLQLKLESEGYERPGGMDDDLMENL